MDGTDKMEVEFGDEKKQRENTNQEASIEVLQTKLTSRTSMSNKVLLFRDMLSCGGYELAAVTLWKSV